MLTLSERAERRALELGHRMLTGVECQVLSRKGHPTGETHRVQGKAALFNDLHVIEFFATKGLNEVREVEMEFGLKLVGSNGSMSRIMLDEEEGDVYTFRGVFASDGPGWDSVRGDVCRNTSLWFRLNPEPVSALLGIFWLKVIEDHGDGQAYYPLEGNIADALGRDAKNRLQVTAYAIMDDGNVDPYGATCKGLIGTPSWKVDYSGADLAANGNFIKGVKYPVGTIIPVLLYRQAYNLEHHQLRSIRLSGQAVVRMMECLSEQGISTVKDSITDLRTRLESGLADVGSVCQSVFGQEGLENNEFVQKVQALHAFGVPVTPTDVAKIVTLHLKKEMYLYIKGFVFYAFGAPDLKGNEVRLPFSMADRYKVGDVLGSAQRSPTIASEFIPSSKVAGFAHGFENSVESSKFLTEDNDSDFRKQYESPIIGASPYWKRWTALQSFLGGTVENIPEEGGPITLLEAVEKAIRSKTAVALWDNHLTATEVFPGEARFSARWAEIARNMQQAVDSAKKRFACPFPPNTDERVPAVYKLLGRKFETLDQWNDLVIKARNQEKSRPGRLGMFTRALVNALPVVVLPSWGRLGPDGQLPLPTPLEMAALKGTSAENLVKDQIPRLAWEHGTRFLASLSEEAESTAWSIVTQYKDLAKALATAGSEKYASAAMADLVAFSNGIAGSNQKVTATALQAIAANILLGNPMRMIASAAILFHLPWKCGNYDLMAILRAWKQVTGYVPRYWIGTVRMKDFPY